MDFPNESSCTSDLGINKKKLSNFLNIAVSIIIMNLRPWKKYYGNTIQ